MAGFSLPPPEVFLAVPGEPAVPWTRWLTGFNAYVDALGFSDDVLPDKRKTAILVHCLGTEGQRVLGALGSATTFEDTVKLLTDHFSGKQRRCPDTAVQTQEAPPTTRRVHTDFCS